MIPTRSDYGTVRTLSLSRSLAYAYKFAYRLSQEIPKHPQPYYKQHSIQLPYYKQQSINMRFRKRANPTQNTAPQLPGEDLGSSESSFSVAPITDSEHPPTSGRVSAREHFRHPHITLIVSLADPHSARIADTDRLDRFDLRHALVMSTGPKHYIEELTFKTEENHQKLPKLDQNDGEPAEILADFFSQLPNLRKVNLQMSWPPAQALFLDVLATQPQLQLTQLVIHAPTYKPHLPQCCWRRDLVHEVVDQT